MFYILYYIRQISNEPFRLFVVQTLCAAARGCPVSCPPGPATVRDVCYTAEIAQAARCSPVPAMPPAHELGLHGHSRPGRPPARRHRTCVPGFAICWHPELRNHVRLRSLYWQIQNRIALPTTGPKKHGCSSMSTDSKRF